MEPLPNRRGNKLERVRKTGLLSDASMEPLPNRRGNYSLAQKLYSTKELQWSPFRIEGETRPSSAPSGASRCFNGAPSE